MQNPTQQKSVGTLPLIWDQSKTFISVGRKTQSWLMWNIFVNILSWYIICLVLGYTFTDIIVDKDSKKQALRQYILIEFYSKVGPRDRNSDWALWLLPKGKLAIFFFFQRRANMSLYDVISCVKVKPSETSFWTWLAITVNDMQTYSHL